MAGTSGSAPREQRFISGATLSLIAVAFSELRGDLRYLLDSAWDEPVRRRAEELASTLSKACLRQGLNELMILFRSTANLTRLSRADALLVLPALEEKLESLMRDIQVQLPKRSKGSMA